MYGYIYKTTNLCNGRIYIGQKHGDFNADYLGSGILLEQAIRKYGKSHFKVQILAFATTRKMLNSLEIKYIAKYRRIFKDGFLYNIADGGESGPGMRGKHHTEAWKKAISRRMRGKKAPFYHKHHSVAILKKISEAVKRAYQDPKLQEYMSKVRTGRINSKAQTRKFVKALKRLWKDPIYRAHQIHVRLGSRNANWKGGCHANHSKNC